MKAKNAPRDTEAADIEHDRVELRRKLDAIGEANKWLRTSMSKASGRYVGDQDVALLVRPVLNELRRPGCLWVAVLYAVDGSETTRPKWTGTDWFTALTSAVFDLVDDEVLDIAQRHGRDQWFKFETIHGEEITP